MHENKFGRFKMKKGGRHKVILYVRVSTECAAYVRMHVALNRIFYHPCRITCSIQI